MCFTQHRSIAFIIYIGVYTDLKAEDYLSNLFTLPDILDSIISLLEWENLIN